MKRKFYHGTSADNLRAILKHGLRFDRGPRNWAVSLDAIYFWDPQRMEDCDDDNEREQRARQRAAESADFGLCRAKDCRRLVIQVEIDDEEMQDDDSCQNMTEAVCLCRAVKPSEITAIWRDADDLSLFRPYFAACRHERDMAIEVDFSSIETLLIEAVKGNERFMCEAMEALSELFWSMELIHGKAAVAA